MRSAIPFDILAVVVSVFDRLDVFGIHTDVIRKVSPFGVEIVDQLFFPFPTPSLQLLFTMDTCVKQIIYFVINQFIGVVSVGKAFIDVELMLGHSSPKISSNANVEGGVVLVGQYIDDSLQRHKRLYNIFVVVVRLKIRNLLHSRKGCRHKAGMRTRDTDPHNGSALGFYDTAQKQYRKHHSSSRAKTRDPQRSQQEFRLNTGMRPMISFNILAVVVSVFDRLDVFGIHTDVFGQVSPLGVKIVDQLFFPLPAPFLQLLLTTDTCVKQIIYFVINQFIGVVSVGKAFIDVELMLGHSSPKISSNANVEGGVVLVGQYIDDSLQRHKRLYNIFVVVVGLKIRNLLYHRQGCRLRAGMRTGDPGPLAFTTGMPAQGRHEDWGHGTSCIHDRVAGSRPA